MADKLSRRKVISSFGLTGLGLLASNVQAANSNPISLIREGENILFYSSLVELKESTVLKAGNVVQTGGYYQIGDGGEGTYIIRASASEITPDGGGIISLKKNLIAVLINVREVNYKCFGAVGDKKNDDGVQIKAAHDYANKHRIPVINLSGEYWFRETTAIVIKTNVDWGQSIFHFDEKFNGKEPRFKVLSDVAPYPIELSEQAKDSLISQLKPGAQVIPELAPYKNCLVIVADSGDMIGLRNQSTGISRGWAREELFYVEEHGRIVGEMAWTFKNYTSLMAYPASDSYLTITGGTFYLSGDNEGNYVENGIRIERSRTLVSNQWVGLEPGKQDVAKIQRSGFYSLRMVYDVVVENIRLIPWEKDRPGVPMVPQGTYGISGNRWMNVTFRNITAEGSPVHWGVFGTNLTKNFRIENCMLNRVDVHFHCWNLYIKDSKVGQRGLTLTGGGDLFVENTLVNANAFISFRADYGAKWDGDIRIKNCRLVPRTSATQVSVLQFVTADFDFKYPIGYGRTLSVQDMVVDFSGQQQSKAVCWLMKTSEWVNNAGKVRLFFPEQMDINNVSIRGRKQGLRLFQLYDCSKYYMNKEGSYDGVRMESNCRILIRNVDLEKLNPSPLSAVKDNVHFYLNDTSADKRPDALYPDIRFEGCRNMDLYTGNGTANLRFENCTISRITKNVPPFKGRLSFTNSEFIPEVEASAERIYDLDSELGVSFSDCTVYMPEKSGQKMSDWLFRIGFIQINKQVRFNHSNTRLGNDIIQYCKSKSIKLDSNFIGMLKSHHELDAEL
ncbi:MAG TPA: hypothetical protein VGE44_16985 [Daejeonella sp.]|uniref:hypothetical protein n=1 Tax=Daejeonella sp. TaxID=2805397 RepID=UPI002ED866B6